MFIKYTTILSAIIACMIAFPAANVNAATTLTSTESVNIKKMPNVQQPLVDINSIQESTKADGKLNYAWRDPEDQSGDNDTLISSDSARTKGNKKKKKGKKSAKAQKRKNRK